MQAKKLLYEELELLNAHDILKVYDLVIALKKKDIKEQADTKRGYLKTREYLKGINGSLAQDIIEERQDRI